MAWLRFFSALLLSCGAIAASGNTSLVSHDYVPGSGDNWITRDAKSGLEWLDVALTANQTFDQVRTGEWYARGFRHATKSEVRILFANAGTPDDNFSVGTTYYFETQALATLLGPTILGPGAGARTIGYIGTDFLDKDISLSTHPLGQTFSAQLGKVDFLASQYIGEAHFTMGHPFSNEASPDFGSFLVRAVPEPETYAMLISGLFVIGACARRRRGSFAGDRCTLPSAAPFVRLCKSTDC